VSDHWVRVCHDHSDVCHYHSGVYHGIDHHTAHILCAPRIDYNPGYCAFLYHNLEQGHQFERLNDVVFRASAYEGNDPENENDEKTFSNLEPLNGILAMRARCIVKVVRKKPVKRMDFVKNQN